MRFTAADLSHGYDDDGNRPLVRNALGLTTRFEHYTPFGKPQRITRPDGTLIDLEFDDRSGLVRRRTESLVLAAKL